MARVRVRREPASGGSLTYEPRRYWTDLLGESPTLRSVAYPELPESLNRALYRAMIAAVLRALERAQLSKPIAGSSVCDIGCGSGVWVDFWHGLGASDVAGVDIAAAPIARLRTAYPQSTFVQADISEERPPFARKFDLVSAMSVLLHVKDDARFARAIANIAALLRPGGTLLVMDPVVVHQWWGRPFDPSANSKARPVDEWRRVLAANGLDVVDLVPVTALLANPADTKRRVSFRALELYWSALAILVGRSERAGDVIGRVLLPLDRLVLSLTGRGPSTKVLVARRHDDSRDAREA